MTHVTLCWRGCLTAVVALFAWAGGVVSEVRADAVQVRFGTFDLAPYSFKNPNAPQRGMLSDFNAAIATHAGLTFTDLTMPLKRVNRELEKGFLDCACFIPSSWSRESFVLVHEVISKLNSVVVPRRGLEIGRFEDLYGHTVAMPRGAYRGWPLASDPKIQRYHTRSYAQSAVLLASGRVDAMVGTDIAVYYNLARAGVTRGDIGQPFVFLTSTVWLHCRKDFDTAIVDQLRAAAKTLKADGAFDAIQARYAAMVAK